ncbi:hypothetical protein EV141_0109 [Microcella putealis]|uniref:Uncharacterized protein n=1 Tax=Microcella putealis TaxID=337005 RepID=A0A4Q7LXY6_9MICO|nr:hypothetical protein [Microcella putealis]RZS58899.1 hypothetical protein EV141_0109 [Microcella putealis]TQM23925.1 hypothetical protein BJ957_1388 [Microcella putealis]
MTPNTAPQGPTRDAVLRAELVARASTPESPRRYAPGRVVAASILAFGLAGATTGAAVAATGAFSPQETIGAVQIEMEEMRSITFPGTEFFGTPLIITGSGTTIVELGERPQDASTLALRVGCIDPGRFDITIDETPDGWVQCDSDDVVEGPTIGGFSSQYDVSDEAPRTLSVSGTSGDRYVIWVSWAAAPERAEPSNAQQDALADGTVTRDEYLAGLDRYIACMEDLGWSVGVVDRDADVIDYRIEAVAGADDALCYAAEFEQLDMGWQLSREDG